MNYADARYFERAKDLKDPENYKELSRFDQETLDQIWKFLAEVPHSLNGYPQELKRDIDMIAENLSSIREGRHRAKERGTTFRPGGMPRMPQL